MGRCQASIAGTEPLDSVAYNSFFRGEGSLEVIDVVTAVPIHAREACNDAVFGTDVV